jgi:cell division protein FtsI/penicillin-binding protein 2
VGQGRFDVTPLQAANMAATIASGQYRPATIRLDDPRPAEDLPIPKDAWLIVREGMYKAVNEPGGTAHGEKRGTLGDPQFVLLGKTGSAEVPLGRTVERLYVCHLPDGRVQEIVAADQAGALAQADCPPADRDKIKVAGSRSYRRYPPDPPESYTHAWFIGYLAPRGRHLAPVQTGQGGVAIAVVIEYTGHGGEVAAPVARDMLRSFLSHIRGQATVSGPGGGP